MSVGKYYAQSTWLQIIELALPSREPDAKLTKKRKRKIHLARTWREPEQKRFNYQLAQTWCESGAALARMLHWPALLNMI